MFVYKICLQENVDLGLHVRFSKDRIPVKRESGLERFRCIFNQ